MFPDADLIDSLNDKKWLAECARLDEARKMGEIFGWSLGSNDKAKENEDGKIVFTRRDGDE